jgi:hypothetical protein
MKSRIALTVTAFVLVAGCKASFSTNTTTSSTGNAATNAAAPANTGAPAAPANTASAAPPAGSGAPVDQAWLVGKWGGNGDCTRVMDFRADGTVVEPGDLNGTYTISGSTVTINTPGHAPDPADVTKTGDDSMTIVPPGQAPRSLQRCQ